MNNIFAKGWESDGTVCGWGSEIRHTTNIRAMLPRILRGFCFQSINDAGCGDLNWMSTIQLGSVDYKGYDLNRHESWKGHNCEVLDVVNQPMRQADLIICRDVFIHLPNESVVQALANFRKSSRWLLTTSFEMALNQYRTTEPSLRYHPLNLCIYPFGLGKPVMTVPEDYPGKYMGLWYLGE